MMKAMTLGGAFGVADAFVAEGNPTHFRLPPPGRSESIHNGARATIQEAILSRYSAVQIAQRNLRTAREKDNARAASYWAAVVARLTQTDAP